MGKLLVALLILTTILAAIYEGFGGVLQFLVIISIIGFFVYRFISQPFHNDDFNKDE